MIREILTYWDERSCGDRFATRNIRNELARVYQAAGRFEDAAALSEE